MLNIVKKQKRWKACDLSSRYKQKLVKHVGQIRSVEMSLRLVKMSLLYLWNYYTKLLLIKTMYHQYGKLQKLCRSQKYKFHLSKMTYFHLLLLLFLWSVLNRLWKTFYCNISKIYMINYNLHTVKVDAYMMLYELLHVICVHLDKCKTYSRITSIPFKDLKLLTTKAPGQYGVDDH